MKPNINAIINRFLNIDDLKAKSKKFLFAVGKDAFLVILFILIVEIIFAEILFYQYVLSVEIKEPSPQDGSVGFREKEYQSIVKEWQVREDSLKNSLGNAVSNPFQP